VRFSILEKSWLAKCKVDPDRFEISIDKNKIFILERRIDGEFHLVYTFDNSPEIFLMKVLDSQGIKAEFA
jgi:hypothetical protein